MNILIPHNWLLDHLQTTASPQDLQKLLSLSGPSVEKIYQQDGEPVYDIEVTTNRVDSMSVRGVAREAVAILNRAGIEAQLKPLNLTSELAPNSQKKLPLPQVNNNPELCNRVLAVVLADVKPNPTPEWMATRLKQVELQVHNSLVDITNYVTHDLGHPCHAFDYDKMMEKGGVINIKQAQAGKKFVTLDGEEYQTIGGEIVFENQKREIIDLPAIKGTKNTSVDSDTTNILLWIENLDPQKVRFASMSHAIRTTAAQLNEKEVDPCLGKQVMLKGVELYCELAGASIASSLYDDFPNKPQLKPVIVSQQKIESYLGIQLSLPEIVRMLELLGCEVKVEESSPQQAELEIQPPSFRPDLRIPADIIEEIARIYGYHNLPSQLMTGAIPTQKPTNSDFALEKRIKYFLADIGWQELYTYSAVSKEMAKQSGQPLSEHLKIANPLTEDLVYLRRSLIPSLEAAILKNPQVENVSFFELANVYQPQENKLPQHNLQLGMITTLGYRQLRGEVEALLRQFYLSPIKIKPEKDLKLSNAKQQAKILTADQNEANPNHDGSDKMVALGTITVLKTNHIAVELDYQALVQTAKKYPVYQPLARTSLIKEDLTFTLPSDTLVGEVLDTIRTTHQWVQTVELKDSYQQNYTFTIEYQDPEHNLTTVELKPIRESIVKRVEEKLAGKLVGKL